MYAGVSSSRRLVPIPGGLVLYSLLRHQAIGCIVGSRVCRVGVGGYGLLCGVRFMWSRVGLGRTFGQAPLALALASPPPINE